MNEFVVVSIYDKVSQCYGAPQTQVNLPSAQRWFRSVIVRNEFAEPTDFELYQLGTFSVDGKLVAFDKPKFVEKGVIADEA